jgi:hypothetical protein
MRALTIQIVLAGRVRRSTMVNTRSRSIVATLVMAFGLATVVNTVAHAQEKKPNILRGVGTTMYKA